MNCKYCGAEIPKDANNCPNCGFVVERIPIKEREAPNEQAGDHTQSILTIKKRLNEMSESIEEIRGIMVFFKWIAIVSIIGGIIATIVILAT